MNRLSNDERAEWAAVGLDAYGEAKEGSAAYDEPEDMAADMISDLLHLIRAHGADPLKKLATAQMNFEAEELEGGAA